MSPGGGQEELAMITQNKKATAQARKYAVIIFAKIILTKVSHIAKSEVQGLGYILLYPP